MVGKRVLLTNCCLRYRGGTQLYVRDLSLGLQRAGYDPVVWSPQVGAVADEMRAAGIPVFDDLADVGEPDVLHCHHHDETLAALSRFADRPGVYVQHDSTAWQDEPPRHPRLMRYIAVDEMCRARLVECGIAADSTAIIGNSVALDRYPARDPLPIRPKRALLLSNYATEQNFVPIVREACERMGIEFDVAGSGVGAMIADPGLALPRYDLVFAKARVALEALAVGCAVVAMDVPGIGGLVRSDAIAEWRRWNFGRGLFTEPHDVDLLCREIDRYDADDAARCRDYVRTNCGVGTMVDLLLAEYECASRGWTGRDVDHRGELVAASTQLGLVGPLRETAALNGSLVAEHSRLVGATRELESASRDLVADRDSLAARSAALSVELDKAVAERDAHRIESARLLTLNAATNASLADALKGLGDAQAARDEALAERLQSLSARDDAVAEAERFRVQAEVTRNALAALLNTRTIRLRAAVLRSRLGPMVRASVRAMRSRRR